MSWLCRSDKVIRAMAGTPRTAVSIPIELLAPALDGVTGTLAIGATRVRVEPSGAKGRLVTLEQPAMEQSELITISRR